MKLQCFLKIARLLSVLFICSPSSLPAQQVMFSASLDTNRIFLDKQFDIRFTVESRTSCREFQAPPMREFSIISGPNQTTNMQIQNGVVSQSISYSYTLRPHSIGKFVIEPAIIDCEGRQYRTQSITVEVNPPLGKMVTLKGEVKARMENVKEGSDLRELLAQNKNNLSERYFDEFFGKESHNILRTRITITEAMDNSGNPIRKLKDKSLIVFGEKKSELNRLKGEKVEVVGILNESNEVDVIELISPKAVQLESLVQRRNEDTTSSQIAGYYQPYQQLIDSSYDSKQEAEDNLIWKLKKHGLEKGRFRIPQILPQGGSSARMTVRGSKKETPFGVEQSASPIQLYPKDTEVFSINTTSGGWGMLPTGNGSIWCIVGLYPFSIKGYTFEGDESDPLTFLLLQKKGLIYLHGKGKVVTRQGKEIKLGLGNIEK